MSPLWASSFSPNETNYLPGTKSRVQESERRRRRSPCCISLSSLSNGAFRSPPPSNLFTTPILTHTYTGETGIFFLSFLFLFKKPSLIIKKIFFLLGWSPLLLIDFTGCRNLNNQLASSAPPEAKR